MLATKGSRHLESWNFPKVEVMSDIFLINKLFLSSSPKLENSNYFWRLSSTAYPSIAMKTSIRLNFVRWHWIQEVLLPKNVYRNYCNKAWIKSSDETFILYHKWYLHIRRVKGETPIELLKCLSQWQCSGFICLFVSHTSWLTHLHNGSSPNTVRLTGHRMVRSLGECI